MSASAVHTGRQIDLIDQRIEVGSEMGSKGLVFDSGPKQS